MSIGVSPGRQRQAKFKVTLVNVMSFMPVRLGEKKKKNRLKRWLSRQLGVLVALMKVLGLIP